MKKWLLLVLLSISIFAAGKVQAQGCAMCTSTAGNLKEDSARGLNNGILYLAAIPLIFISVTGVYWYRNNKKDRSYDYEA